MVDLENCAFENFTRIILEEVQVFDQEEVEFSTVVDCAYACIGQGASVSFEAIDHLAIAKSREIKSKSTLTFFIQSGPKGKIKYRSRKKAEI